MPEMAKPGKKKSMPKKMREHIGGIKVKDKRLTEGRCNDSM